jgi:hypothetical protein
LPGHRKPRRLYRLDFSDQPTLRRELNVPVRTHFGVDFRLATTTLAALTWIPGAPKAPRGQHLPGTDHWIVVARGYNGMTRRARGQSQSRATATAAAAAAAHASRAPTASTPCTAFSPSTTFPPTSSNWTRRLRGSEGARSLPSPLVATRIRRV